MYFQKVRGLPMLGYWMQFDILMLQMLSRLLSDTMKIRISTYLIVMFNDDYSHSPGLHREYKMW